MNSGRELINELPEEYRIVVLDVVRHLYKDAQDKLDKTSLFLKHWLYANIGFDRAYDYLGYDFIRNLYYDDVLPEIKGKAREIVDNYYANNATALTLKEIYPGVYV